MSIFIAYSMKTLFVVKSWWMLNFMLWNFTKIMILLHNISCMLEPAGGLITWNWNKFMENRLFNLFKFNSLRHSRCLPHVIYNISVVFHFWWITLKIKYLSDGILDQLIYSIFVWIFGSPWIWLSNILLPHPKYLVYTSSSCFCSWGFLSAWSPIQHLEANSGQDRLLYLIFWL